MQMWIITKLGRFTLLKILAIFSHTLVLLTTHKPVCPHFIAQFRGRKLPSVQFCAQDYTSFLRICTNFFPIIIYILQAAISITELVANQAFTLMGVDPLHKVSLRLCKLKTTIKNVCLTDCTNKIYFVLP